MHHPWFQGRTATKAEIIQEFTRRQNIVDQARLQAEMAEAEEERNNDAHRGPLKKGVKALKPYIKAYAHNSEFFSNFSPEFLEEKLIEYLDTSLGTPSTTSDTKFKVKYTIKYKEESISKQGAEFKINHDQELVVCFKITKVEKTDKVCVEFIRKSGDKLKFNEHFKEMKEKAFKNENNAYCK